MSGSDEEGLSWLGAARGLAEAQSAGGELTVGLLSDRLLALDRLIRSAPPKIRNCYVRFPEAELVQSAERRIAAMERGRWAWSVTSHQDVAVMLWPAAVEARATDALLRRIRPREAPLDAAQDWRTSCGTALLAPCRPRRPGRRNREGQPYERRGLYHHRVLPTAIGKFEVVLVAGDATPPPPLAGAPLFLGGAALFEGLAVATGGEPKRTFVVTRSEAPDHRAQIEHALVRAHEDRCTALVWPELTISPDDRSAVVSWLQSRLLTEQAELPEVSLVLAGSWHETEGSAVVNRSVVYDGCGQRLLTFEKAVAYHSDEWGTEDIHESRVLKVLLLEDTLIGFGICRDFADTGLENALASLDVDLFLVPSMGNRRTMEGHLTTARLVGDRSAARAFIVQQSEPESEDQLGFVVPPTPTVAGLDAEATLQADPFAAYDGG